MSDASLFSVNTRDGEYRIEIDICGKIKRTINAASLEEAQACADKIVDDIFEGSDDAELDDIDDAKVAHVYKTRPTYRVIRSGQAMQVSHLLPGDLPRQPDERGF